MAVVYLFGHAGGSLLVSSISIVSCLAGHGKRECECSRWHDASGPVPRFWRVAAIVLFPLRTTEACSCPDASPGT
jgi:hypothetical protein